MKAVGGGDAQLCDGRAINLFVKEGSYLYCFSRELRFKRVSHAEEKI